MKNEENKKYETILLERLENKIDAIIEGQKITDTKVDSLETKVDLLVEDMDEVKARLVNVEDEVKEINIKLDNKVDNVVIENHEKRLIKLEKMSLVKV
ncbi:MAG: hypothetical protein US30_C0027G0001 [Candidatus Moranbacteria bacterium GW2011_GWF2_36_839]|nr:MAG: hypothetical protein US27_C0024G0001 [Candidatus Moranbacteria bacterium GW2011_GWF1_36_78]KKQ15861.1 MAG: hypothetical protein US30_C0027G0001 [Candidatus Moranbacteria bacterium GW2011_GWF2_36_839]HAT74414.1 hypothetical protein [Candidatus Moranbacteria bacterium]HBY11099.1 hypothetical protein [Candidatus Moranbacteria bacterium]